MQASAPSRRLLFDLSTSMRWFGPPVGIVRVERELAFWALENDPNCRFVFFDPDLQVYREIRQQYLRSLLEGAAIVDTTGMSDPSRSRPRKTDRVPRFLLEPFLWITQSRRMTIRALERLRLRGEASKIGTIIGRLQQFIAGKKYIRMLTRSKGVRRAVIPLDMLTGDSVTFEPGDLVLLAGSNWAHSNVTYISEQKNFTPIRLVTLCHDIIPLVFPKYYEPHDVALLRRHFDVALANSFLILVTSKVIAGDIHQYCAEHGIAVGPVQQIALGFDLPDDRSVSTNLPHPLGRSRYVMLVSTIEPRKGHQLIQAVWSRLLREGLPQLLDFHLVLIGRPGWMVSDLLKVLLATDRIVIMDNVEDSALAALYDGAAFCVYPSEYEGYGLPVVEALGRGKAVLASNVGIVPELRSSLLRPLSPNDAESWYIAIKEWLVNPESRNSGPGEGAISFCHPSWQEAAAQSFAAIYKSLIICRKEPTQ